MRDACIRTGVILVFLALTGLGCESRIDEANEEERLIGVKIYENERPLPALFEEWKALGINTVFARVELSTLDEFRALANAHDISLFLILPTFFKTSTESRIKSGTVRDSPAQVPRRTQ